MRTHCLQENVSETNMPYDFIELCREVYSKFLEISPNIQMKNNAFDLGFVCGSQIDNLILLIASSDKCFFFLGFWLIESPCLWTENK